MLKDSLAAELHREIAPRSESGTWSAGEGLSQFEERNERNRRHQAALAYKRDAWINRNGYYYASLNRLLKHIIEPGRRVLNMRCQTGIFLHALQPAAALGVEISREMVDIARSKYPQYRFERAFPELFQANEKFDYIFFSDIGDTADVQGSLQNLRACCQRHTRLVISNYNHLWEPLVKLAEKLHLKIPQTRQNWLSEHDIRGLLALSGYEWLKTYRIMLVPKYVPLVSEFFNRLVAKLPLLNRLCMTELIVARPRFTPLAAKNLSVSVVIPCKDERGNIEAAVRRLPDLGRRTEIIFCDDKSQDGTADEVRRVAGLYPERDIKLVEGPGICKSLNVWAGFRVAHGDVLMILDADLAVMPEELPKFLDSMASGVAEFANGSRLVYPLPKGAMRITNMLGNKFFGVLFSYLLGQRVKDTLCGTKVLWRSDWQRIEPMLDSWGAPDHWGDYELLFGAAKLNLRIYDLPIHYQERLYGISKMTNVIKQGIRMLRIWIHGFITLKYSY